MGGLWPIKQDESRGAGLRLSVEIVGTLLAAKEVWSLRDSSWLTFIPPLSEATSEGLRFGKERAPALKQRRYIPHFFTKYGMKKIKNRIQYEKHIGSFVKNF